jgi:hypothetical protein
MEVSLQLHKPTVLPQGEKQLLLTDYKAEWAPELVWTFGEEKNLSPMLEIKSHSAHSLATIPTELSLMVYMKTTSYLTKTSITPTSRSVSCP